MTGLGHKKNSFQSCTLLVCACQDTINEPFFISQYLVSVCRFSGRSVSQVNLSLRGRRKKERGRGREKSAKEGKRDADFTEYSFNLTLIPFAETTQRSKMLRLRIGCEMLRWRVSDL